MTLVTKTQIASSVGLSIPTLAGLVRTGVIPRPDIRAGREGYYSEELASEIMRWLRDDYVPYKRGQRFEVKEGK